MLARSHGPRFKVLWHPGAEAEREAIADARERDTVERAREKLEAHGPRLTFPHQSAVRGGEGQGLRELRPRGGRSRWRPIFRRVKPDVYVIFAIGPEAQIDKRGFDAAVRRAQERLPDWETALNG